MRKWRPVISACSFLSGVVAMTQTKKKTHLNDVRAVFFSRLNVRINRRREEDEQFQT